MKRRCKRNAVIQAAEAVISICCDYRSSVKDSSWEVPRVLEGIHSPQSVLQVIEELAHKGETQGSTDQPRSPALGLLCDADTGVLGQCRTELEKYGRGETVLCSTAIEEVLEQQNSAVEKAVD
ncbi:hypothetical protein IMSHALPRED_002810 [Imshaugia aleurites]|uniref:Uncharacterized protein n=1 Tax=Imshaugia aleurites TaxID=172621 RepID=A0A8H3J6F6_9LECA|nr:hypothetical protein IMSHALPRED_002810 [Imshaugia aleurites]